jgi:hypothetical protein
MSKKLYFRADKRSFRPGDQIRTAGHFMSMSNQLGKAVEKALASARLEGKTPRKNCLMLFEDKTWGREFCARMNGTLYIVSIAAGSILHRGDLHLFEEMANRVKRGKDVFNEARRYWDGELTKDPCVEVLVRAGTVDDLIEDEYEREAEFQRYIRRDRQDAERREKEFLQTYHEDWE